ncbi:hypothetical protein ACN28S_45020 [Cystobacter fuscus]
MNVTGAYDPRVHGLLPRHSLAKDMKEVFDKLPPKAREKQAFMKGALQRAYLIRGPMAGFDNAKVDAALLSGTSWKGSISATGAQPDSTRAALALDFEESTSSPR